MELDPAPEQARPAPASPRITADLPAVLPPFAASAEESFVEVAPASTAFESPPSTPPLEVPQPDIPDDYMLGADLPPAIDSSALEVPPAPPPRRPVTEERVRIVDMEEEPAAALVTVDTDSDVVVVNDSADEFAPPSGLDVAPAVAAAPLTPSHPF
ncbi:MAG TPA: hypothetical protein P5076_19440, partial [Myxococcota bacterium]|nr:hypothetical protein [Myxococcota bacterium]